MKSNEQSKTNTVLPPLYARWMDQLLDKQLESEKLADCLNCPMCKDQNEPGDQLETQFQPIVKCCTFYPGLPNYLVGQILKDNRVSSDIMDIIRSKIDERSGVTPLGISPTLAEEQKYKTISGQGRFGKADGEVRCPYYVDQKSGICGIRNYRNCVCTTWFCKRNHGLVSYYMWDAIRRLLHHIEESLASWCLLELEVEDDALDLLCKKDSLAWEQLKEDAVDTHLLKRAWGKFENNKIEFYKQCGHLVNTLDWTDIESICGPQLKILARSARLSQASLTMDQFPEYVTINSQKTRTLDNGNISVQTYSRYQSFEIPMNIGMGLMMAIPLFQDPCKLEELIKNIESTSGQKLSKDQMNLLFQSGIITPAHSIKARSFMTPV